MVTAVFDNLNALLTSEAAPQDDGVEILYTSPDVNETPDDQLLFRRLEALQFFKWALPIGEV